MIFTLLSSGRKNCWEGNEQVNQMFKNILKKKKKSHLELGQPIIEPKRKHTIPNNSARPLIYKQNLYGGHKKKCSDNHCPKIADSSRSPEKKHRLLWRLSGLPSK